MRQFFWKIVICLVPCLLAAYATVDATVKYYRGDSGGFKLGVDLVGGTILVYEIDLRKNQDANKTFDPLKDINVLAESLKRRIDPNDLFNITIRPAGGEGRIEIILPTGGTHRTTKAEATWNTLLKNLQEKYIKDSDRKLEVGRGKILELADEIQSIQSESLWKEKLFSSQEGWDRLVKNALNYWARIPFEIAGDPDKKPAVAPNKQLEEALNDVKKKPGDLKGFTNFVVSALAETDAATTTKTVQNWIKKQAWDETMTQIRLTWGKKWAAELKLTGDAEKKYMAQLQEDMERIAPDSNDQLTTFVMTRGTVIGQAALSLISPLVGEKYYDRVFDDDPNAEEIRKFITDRYGPPIQAIMKDINDYMKDSGLGKDLSVEHVQHIKDLVSKVGSLEFSILANSTDDLAVIGATLMEGDARKLINDPLIAEELAEAQKRGLPPPAPREMRGGELKPKKYIIVTAHNVKSAVSYRWVELGPQERRALNLDNAARTDSTRNAAWHAAKNNRNKAIQLPESAGSTDKFILQGALFYSRECKDTNLPEEERRQKEVEYFVLTRDPEFESLTSEVRTPKIDGSYLVNAYGAPGADLRPTVHFSFNTEGGNLFGTITRKNVSQDSGGPEGTQKRRHLAIILDGMVMSAPTINSEIRTQGQISGNFTQKEVDSLVNILRAGRLPATLKPQPVSESTIAATLGEDTITAGVTSIVLGFLAILVFMIIYYRFAGLVAAVALLANLLLTVGFMVAVQATFTLSGLAGLVLTLGMAIDANVLIYERLREERERGGSILQALRNGYDRALPTILDSHVTTILTAVILYVVGNDNLKGFAVSAIVGLVFSLLTSIVMTRLIFDIWQYKGWLTNLSMMRLFAKPDIDFMGIRKAVFTVAAVLAVGGIALFIGRVPNDLGIDFVGGTAYGGQLKRGVTQKELRPLVGDEHQKEMLEGVTVQEIEGSEGRRFELTFPSGDKRTVSFSNIPDGKTPQEREELVRVRAKRLPEPSVELLFSSSNDAELVAEMKRGVSRNFVIRTTEKEAELVQAMLDQLLREGNEQLLKKVYARYDAFDKQNRENKFRFYATAEEAAALEAKKETGAASQSFFKSLLNRELRRSFGIQKDTEPLPFLFEVVGEGSSDRDGKFYVMKVSFDKNLKIDDEAQLAKVERAFREAVTAFSARPLPDRLDNFDSALATETRFRALWAILASWAGILLYLWFRFGSWTFGLAAVTCVIHDIFLTLGIIAASYFVHDTLIGSWLMLEDFKLDLTAVASLLTLVGYSVNDKIVVFDRIREVRGKNPELTPKMINDSINQTLSRTVLTSMTIAVVFLLYVFGGPGLHLFAFIMMIGVIIGTFSSIYIASPLLLIFGEGKHEDAHSPGGKAAAPTPEGATA